LFEGSEALKQTLDAVWRLAVRRRWALLLSACTIALATAAGSLLLPNQYVSEATIIVEQQQVPERYVTPTSTSDVSSALLAMEQDVLSNARLLRIIDDLGLYPKARKRAAPEDLLATMRSNIEITPLEGDPARREVNSLRISFTGDNARTAQQVTSRLTQSFIQENQLSRTQQAEGTTTFLESQLETAKQDLQQQEEKLKDFKMQNLGELPEQQGSNLSILSGLQMQLQNTVSSIGRAQEQRAYQTSLLNEYHDLAQTGAQVPNGQALSPVEVQRAKLAKLNSDRADLLSHETPQNPDVVKIDQAIAQSKQELDKLMAAQNSPSGASGQSPDSAAGAVTGDATTAQIKSQLEANRLEIDDLVKDQKRLEEQITIYQKRLNLTPVREQQLNTVLDDYNSAKKNYDDLLGKKTQSELASSLEQQQQGQQFRIVDPPTLPSKPTSPSRVKICMGGAVAGIGLALGLAIVIEFKKASFYTENELRARVEAPFVLGIPTFYSPMELRRRKRSRVLEWATGSMLVIVTMVVNLYICWRG
jgi:polysaccharide biosynthesis transport protein